MSKSKKGRTPDVLLDAASKDARIVLSEEELEQVTGGNIVLQHEKVTGADTSGSELFREALLGMGRKVSLVSRTAR